MKSAGFLEYFEILKMGKASRSIFSVVSYVTGGPLSAIPAGHNLNLEEEPYKNILWWWGMGSSQSEWMPQQITVEAGQEQSESPYGA